MAILSGHTRKPMVVQSTLAPETLMIFAHLLISASVKRLNSSGVSPTGSAPWATSCSLTLGCLSILTTST